MFHLQRPALLVALAGLSAAVVLLLALPATAASGGIVNGSFQSCDLTGWSTEVAPGAAAGVVPGGYDSNCAGYVSTGSAGVGDHSFLRHDPFWATAGTKISVYAAFGFDCSPGFDEGDVVLDGDERPVPCDGVFHVFQWTTGYTGYHVFEADADNEFDSLFPSTLYVDILKAGGLYKV